MRTRSIVAVVVAAGLMIPATAPMSSAAKKKSGPEVVGKDEPGDWGSNAGEGMEALGEALGQDLVEASIGMADKKTVNFIIKVSSLPPLGGVPESSRYTWDFIVDGEAWNMSGAFTEYLRGVCNPLHTDSCPPPQDPGSAPFFLRQGPCNVGEDCHVRAIAHATFDPAEATITIPVDLETLKAKPGSEISPGVSAFGGSIYAAPALIVAYGSLPNDTMVVEATYTIPGGKRKKKKRA